MADADDLLENAEAARTRLEEAGLPPTALDAAIAAFRALPADRRTPDRAEYSALVVETSRALRGLSLAASSKAGSWGDRFGFSLTVTLCIILSIASMIVVAQLSMVYRDGQAVLTDLKRLKDSRTERRFSELQRQLVYAGKMAAATGATDPTVPGQPEGVRDLQILADADRTQAVMELSPLSEDPIAERMAIAQYYAVLFDLRELDHDIFSVMARFQTFWQDSYQPISFLEGPAKIWRGLRGQNVSEPTLEYRQSYEKAKQESEQAAAAAAAGTYDPCGPLFAKVQADTTPTRNANWLKVLTESVSACRFSADHLLSYNSSGLPIFDTYIHETNYRLMPYSTWVMPMSFAVFGALLYYMRFLMNPLLPSPRLSRILHRVSLSALAGVVISLAWSNISAVGADFQAAGFTVFAVCFLAGFSTDMFFSSLDRWVASAASVGLGKPATADERQKIVESAHG